MIKTRSAPSPTGDPHIGTAYSSLFNYAFAKKNKGKFLLRIEDTDRNRFVEDSEKKIIESLKWLGIIWDEGPFHQSERLELYKKAATELVEKKAAYWCVCSTQRLHEVRKKQQKGGLASGYDKKCRVDPPTETEIKKSAVLRLKVPRRGETSFEDLIRGKITFKNKDIDDAVLLKSDGWPTYHLAAVVDDADMEISHIIRAEEWLSSTPKHVLIFKALRKKLPTYAHLPILRNPDRSKISKRKNPVSLIWYKNEGFLPEAVLNYLGLMGWSMPDEREKFSLSEFVENFDLARVDPAGPVFDLQKLEWLNGEWIRSLKGFELAKRIKSYSKRNASEIEKVLPLVHERLKKLSQFDSLTNYFFDKEINIDKNLIVQKGKDSQETASLLEILETGLKNIDWQKDSIEKVITKNQKKTGWSNKDLFQTVRIAITGGKASPPIFDTLEAIGKENTLLRLRKAINLLGQ